jgi:hemerythrin superfamily protein
MAIRTTLENAGKTVLGALGGRAEAGEADILDTLKQEHDEVQDLLDKLVESDNARECNSLVDKIKRALIPHTKAEEKVVYDAVLALKGRDAKIDGNEGYIEHNLADLTLKKLDRLTAKTPEFSAAAKVLKELIDHHVKEEERNIWAQIRDNFSVEERAGMNRDFEAAKKKVRL